MFQCMSNNNLQREDMTDSEPSLHLSIVTNVRKLILDSKKTGYLNEIIHVLVEPCLHAANVYKRQNSVAR